MKLANSFPHIATAFVLAIATSPGASAADKLQPTVIELFTSQGCSSCPPANANLAALSDRPDVLALSFSVTYWDQLGWKDTFAKPEFTARQVAYEPPLQHDGPFTPQIVVDGAADTIGNRRDAIEDLSRGGRHERRPTLHIDQMSVSIGNGSVPGKAADVWLVTYDPKLVEVPIGRGENAGRTLPHKNVVRTLERIGSWRGGEITLSMRTVEAGLRRAVLVQLPAG